MAADPVSSREQRSFRKEPVAAIAGWLPIRFLGAVVLRATLICTALLVVPALFTSVDDDLSVATVRAQEKRPNPVADARKAVETLINRLRGRDMPEGIVKTNGRIEATQVDVAAKYPGRLATLTVGEGDEVTAGQVVATISSPETEAQLRSAQAQVLKAKQAYAEAVALIAQRDSDLTFARSDFERGKTLLQRGFIAQQVVDQRRNKGSVRGGGVISEGAFGGNGGGESAAFLA